MVKRIRKRIQKSEDATETDVDAGLEDGEGGHEQSLAEELENLGEDEFTRVVAQATGWVIKNQILVAAGIILLVGAFGIVYSMDSVKKSGTAEAAEAFYKAADAYIGVKAPPATGTEATDTDTNSPELFAKAQRDFSNARKMYADQPVAVLAALGEASSQLDLGNAAEAVKLYDEVLAQPALGPFAQIIAHQGRATALEAAGKTADAIVAWNAMGQIDNKNLGLFAGIQTGRLLEAENKKAEARKVYSELQKKYTADLAEFGNREYKLTLERKLAQLGDAG